MIYRIQTEDINRDSIIGIVSRYFDGFTIIPAVGYWQGIRENSLIIEIAIDDEFPDENCLDKISAIAKAIRILNKQNAVLISEIGSKIRFI